MGLAVTVNYRRRRVAFRCVSPIKSRLEQLYTLFANKHAEKPNKRDRRGRGRADLQQSLEHTDDNADDE